MDFDPGSPWALGFLEARVTFRAPGSPVLSGRVSEGVRAAPAPSATREAQRLPAPGCPRIPQSRAQRQRVTEGAVTRKGRRWPPAPLLAPPSFAQLTQPPASGGVDADLKRVLRFGLMEKLFLG